MTREEEENETGGVDDNDAVKYVWLIFKTHGDGWRSLLMPFTP